MMDTYTAPLTLGMYQPGHLNTKMDLAIFVIAYSTLRLIGRSISGSNVTPIAQCSNSEAVRPPRGVDLCMSTSSEALPSRRLASGFGSAVSPHGPLNA